MDLTMKERFIRSVKMESVDKVPALSITQTGTVDLMNLSGAFWPKAHYHPETMADLAIAGHTFTGLEAVRYPFSLLELPEALGCTMSEGTLDSQPHQLDFPVKKPEDVAKISVPDLSKGRGVSVILDATAQIQKKLGDKTDIPLIAGTVGPAALAACVCGVNNYLRWCIQEPDTLTELMVLCADVCVEYTNMLYGAGVDGVLIVDSEAGPDLFPPPLFESMVLPIYKDLTKKIRGLTLLHMCGDATAILEPMAQSGFQGISIEEKTNMAYAAKLIGDKVCLIGNVSPARTILLGTPEDVKRETKQCLEDGTRILSPGCGIAPRTPLGNIKAFVEARDEYYLK
ncbi:Uroporphyrinogen decarboxylase [Methanosarcinaceae archaeon Ag5]|uniref:Uroporphyrinogen decarboxylase n=1 Tax=Methanolapillus africanus TaxID=3028297 RepID=A0AAE4MMI3_9EURY|nr:Uroporphyrinogen decarboxylase [Methanosarcinaceae archaeon Ag5]